MLKAKSQKGKKEAETDADTENKNKGRNQHAQPAPRTPEPLESPSNKPQTAADLSMARQTPSVGQHTPGNDQHTPREFSNSSDHNNLDSKGVGSVRGVGLLHSKNVSEDEEVERAEAWRYLEI